MPAATTAQAQNVLTAEARRRLAPVLFAENTVKTSDLPRDTVLKRIHMDLMGTFVVTYASGSPIAHSKGVAAQICPRLDVVIDGQRTVKSLDIHMQEMMNALMYGGRPRRAYSSGASVTTERAGTEAYQGAAFVYPATTQTLLINEHFVISFENPWAYDLGREATLLNIKNVSSAEIRYNFGAMTAVQRDESSPVSITYSSLNLYFTPTLVEAREVPSDAQFFDFKETVKRQSFSAEVRDALIDLPRGNGLAGIGILVRDGDANRSLRDRGLRDLQLLINGQSIVQRTTFVELQDSQQARNGVYDPLASNDHMLEGFSFINLLKNGDIRSAINTSIGAGVDQIQLAVTTAPSSGNDAATYTNTMEVSVLSMEIAAVPVKSA
jgi:hypothetical protein